MADAQDIKEIYPILEAQMTKKQDRLKILRYMCLLSTTQGGLKKPEFETLKRNYVLNYGYGELVTLMNLQDAGLFKQEEKGWNWSGIKDAFGLVNPDFPEQKERPRSIDFVLNGFAPISVRLIETMLE